MPDPSQYMDAFSKMMQNPQFMSAAEQLGKWLMESGMDSESLAMMKLFQDPANADKLKAKMEELKDDADLGPMIRDIEENGQAAMMKYMNDQVRHPMEHGCVRQHASTLALTCATRSFRRPS